jgi:hypothetical protein
LRPSLTTSCPGKWSKADLRLPAGSEAQAVFSNCRLDRLPLCKALVSWTAARARHRIRSGGQRHARTCLQPATQIPTRSRSCSSDSGESFSLRHLLSGLARATHCPGSVPPAQKSSDLAETRLKKELTSGGNSPSILPASRI